MALRTRLLVGLAVLVTAAVLASGWLILALARSSLAPAREAELQLLLLALALLEGALALVLGALLLRRVMRPLAEVAEVARRVAAGDLAVAAVEAPPGDELARLTDSFNRMTASLRGQREHLLAQEKLATVGRLAAGVAHEVGNPLQAVLGYVEMLLADAPAGSDRRDMLERIRKETERIRHIVADLLDYSRPVKGAVEAVTLAQAVDAAVGLLRPQARFRQVTVDNQVPRDLEAAASASRVVQVLVNLFLNAADAMQGAGAIVVTGRRLDGDGGVALLVRDHGPGVPQAHRDQLFDPFFTTKEPGQGTGLGLAISRSILQAFGGDLLLARTDGPGATFVLHLPAWKG